MTFVDKPLYEGGSVRFPFVDLVWSKCLSKYVSVFHTKGPPTSPLYLLNVTQPQSIFHVGAFLLDRMFRGYSPLP